MRSLRDICMRGIYGVSLASWLIQRNRKRRRVPVLLFHRVSPDPDPFWPPLHPDAFKGILQLFSRHYAFRPLDELTRPQELPSNAAFISFDDAFLDLREHALPILRELQLPATVFVPTDSIDSGEPIWPSLFDRFLEKERLSGKASTELVGLHFELERIEKEGKEKAAGTFKERIKELSYERQLEVLKGLKGMGKGGGIAPMSWDQLRELPENIDLGAHTVHHPYLPSIEKETDIEREMMESKERIQEKTGKQVRSFAYPFGGYDRRSERIASRHFDMAFTTEGTPVHLPGLPDRGSYHSLSRIDVHDPCPQEALLRVNGFHRWIRGRG